VDCSGVPDPETFRPGPAHLVVGYLAGPASPMRVAVSVEPALSATTRIRSLVVSWAVVAVCWQGVGRGRRSGPWLGRLPVRRAPPRCG